MKIQFRGEAPVSAMSCVETQDLKPEQYQAIAFSANQLDDRTLQVREGEPARRHRAANVQTVYT